MNQFLPEGMTAIEPAYRNLLRLGVFMLSLVVFSGASALCELIIYEETDISFGYSIPIAIALIIFFTLFLPNRIYRRIGYEMGADQLRIVRGYLFHSDTIIPFSRIQHVDVNSGPFERAFGLANLIVHTAGSYNHSVTLPGLSKTDAENLRDQIRIYISAHGEQS